MPHFCSIICIELRAAADHVRRPFFNQDPTALKLLPRAPACFASSLTLSRLTASLFTPLIDRPLETIIKRLNMLTKGGITVCTRIDHG
jgi:hypothetical protein